MISREQFGNDPIYEKHVREQARKSFDPSKGLGEWERQSKLVDQSTAALVSSKVPGDWNLHGRILHNEMGRMLMEGR